MFRVPCETNLQYHWNFLLLHLHILLKPLQKLYVPLDTGLTMLMAVTRAQNPTQPRPLEKQSTLRLYNQVDRNMRVL